MLLVKYLLMKMNTNKLNNNSLYVDKTVNYIKAGIKGSGFTWLIFHHFLQGRQLLWLLDCFPARQSTSEKGSTLKGKNFLQGEQIRTF